MWLAGLGYRLWMLKPPGEQNHPGPRTAVIHASLCAGGACKAGMQKYCRNTQHVHLGKKATVIPKPIINSVTRQRSTNTASHRDLPFNLSHLSFLIYNNRNNIIYLPEGFEK